MDATNVPANDLKTLLREHRETLTTRTAGILWLVWGLAIGLATFAATQPGLPSAGASSDDLELQHALSLLGMLFALLVGAIATHLVWSAHALRQDRPVRWLPVGLVGLAAFAVATALVVAVPSAWRSLTGSAMDHYEPAFLWAAAAAATLTFAQRRHAPILPGLVSSLALAGAGLLLAWLPAPGTRDTAFALAAPVLAALAFAAVGMRLAYAPEP